MRAEIPRPLSSRRRPGPPFPALCHAGSNPAPPLMPEREKSLPGSHFVAHHPLERALNRRARNAPASKCPRLQKCAVWNELLTVLPHSMRHLLSPPASCRWKSASAFHVRKKSAPAQPAPHAIKTVRLYRKKE